MKRQVYIGLGSNIGSRAVYLQSALDDLALHQDIFIEKVSSFVETKAQGTTGSQPDYLNAVCKLHTSLSPEDLFQVTQDIEVKYGRTDKGLLLPRTLDLDILFYDDEVISLPDLMIPHPFCHERLFVLKPMMEIAPHFMHPILQQKISELYTQQLVCH